MARDLRRDGHLEAPSILPSGYDVANVNGGPLFARTSVPRRFGPFTSNESFHEFFLDRSESGQIVPVHKFRFQPHEPEPTFTHGDLSSFNILAKGDQLVGIVGWKTAAWFPSYWEYMTAYHANLENDTWAEEIDKVLDPFPAEMEKVRQKEHIRDSVKQIDSNSWLIGELLLHRSESRLDQATWIDDKANSSYTLEKVDPLRYTTKAPDSPYIKLVYEASDASAVWSVGHTVLCKVRHIEEGVTAESETLNFVRARCPSFETPEPLRHVFNGDRSYLFLTRVPGRTLDIAWPSLSDGWRRHYVNTVVGICKEMAQWKGSRLGGVDGGNLPEWYLSKRGVAEDLDSAKLQETCTFLGMDCSDLVFYHADLGPQNIIVEEEPASGRVGIIDFEIAGYLPREWIRTKIRISGAMVLNHEDGLWWKRELQIELGAAGFKDVSDAWMQWQT